MIGSTRQKAVASLFAVSVAGLGFIAGHEGLRLEAYLDPTGVPTICSGHTEGVKIGQTATFEQCNALLRENAGEAGRAVARCTNVAMTQAQYDALVSFVFNVGGSAYCRSTLAKKLNAGDCHGASEEFSRWIYAGGRALPGLISRRSAERAMFESGCE